VKEISAGLRGERMGQEGALEIAGNSNGLYVFEVLARLGFVPRGGAGRERHELERGVNVGIGMAQEAASMPRSLEQKDGLHFGLEEIVVEGGSPSYGRNRRGGLRLRCRFE
jgi:hypothetical protein